MKTKSSPKIQKTGCVCQGAGPLLSEMLRRLGPPEQARPELGVIVSEGAPINTLDVDPLDVGSTSPHGRVSPPFASVPGPWPGASSDPSVSIRSSGEGSSGGRSGDCCARLWEKLLLDSRLGGGACKHPPEVVVHGNDIGRWAGALDPPPGGRG